MKRLESMDALSRLVMSHMKRGILTNCFVPSSSLICEINEERLFFEECGSNLFLFRRRDGFFILNYYLDTQSFLPNGAKAFLPCDAEILTEIAVAGGQRAEAEKLQTDYLKACGFSPTLERIRLMREVSFASATDDFVNNGFKFGKANDTEVLKLYRIITDNLSKKTGCVPTETEFADDVKCGRVYAASTEGGAICGVLRASQSKASAEILQLAVDGKYRRCGIGKGLVKAFLCDAGEKKSVVWTGAENLAAIRLYEGCGFKDSGMTSLVYLHKASD